MQNNRHIYSNDPF